VRLIETVRRLLFGPKPRRSTPALPFTIAQWHLVGDSIESEALTIGEFSTSPLPNSASVEFILTDVDPLILSLIAPPGFTLNAGPELGSDAHRVAAIADEELAAWDAFMADLQAKNRKRNT
jgi:hypothetical protein